MEHFQFIHCNQFNFMPLHEIVRPLVRRLAISVYFWGEKKKACQLGRCQIGWSWQ